MFDRTYPIMPAPAESLVKSLEAFWHTLAIIEITSVVLIAGGVAIVILVLMRRPETTTQERPACSTKPRASGKLVRLTDWRSARIVRPPRSMTKRNV
jgi:hypothetical protein